MKYPDQAARALRAAQTCRTLGLTQADIAVAVGASQSQVSRILKAKGLRTSRLFEEVCLYVERLEGGVTADAVRENEELIGALKATWDGSAAHARALSAVIRSLVVLGSNRAPISEVPTAGNKC
jgi:transcriptional regulator with XRE-family HTH domain